MTMPMATPEEQREYQRRWMAQRRQEWFKANGPCVQCGSWDQLELDHIDPSTKVDHKVWSWSATRRDTEIAKCQVLCNACHKHKTVLNGDIVHGEAVWNSKLTEDDVREIRKLAANGATKRGLARQFGVDEKAIRVLLLGKTWHRVK